VAVDVILGQAVEFGGIGLDRFWPSEILRSNMDCSSVAWSFNFLRRARVASSLSTPARRNSRSWRCHVVTSGGVGFGKIERGESVVDIVIEGDRGLGGAGFGEHGRGVIAESGVGMDLLHESGEIAGGIDLVNGFVEGDESVFNGARAL
jgi:hypothetical protein